MRKRFNLPTYNFCFGKPSASDCTLWLCCCWCALAQEARTGNSYDIVEDKFCLKQTVVDIDDQAPISPLPREDGIPSGLGTSSFLGNNSIASKIATSSPPSSSKVSKEYYSPERISTVQEGHAEKVKDGIMDPPAPPFIQREAF